jgi:hypothetical protein
MADLAIPVDRILVDDMAPEAVPAPTERRQRIVTGLPHRIELDAGRTLTLTLPVGEAARWRDANPFSVVSSSAGERAAFRAEDGIASDIQARAPARLIYRRSGRVMASLPLSAGLRRAVPDNGVDGADIEVEVVDWLLHAGTLRLAGDFGSRLTIRWARADIGASHFGPVPPPPTLIRRLPAADMVLSQVGYRFLVTHRPVRVLGRIFEVRR